MASVSAALLASCTPTTCTALGAPSTRRFASFDTPLVEALEDARIEYLPAERAWILSTSALEERLELQRYPGRGDGPEAYRLIRAYLRARDRNIRTEIGSEGGAPAADVLAGVLGIRLQDESDVRGLPPETAEPALVPVGQQVERTEGGLVLTIRFRGADVPAELEAQARLRPGLPVVEHRSRIRNQGNARLHVAELDSANLLVRGSPEARWLAATLDTDGHVWVAALGGEGALVAETPPLSAARLPVVPVLALQDAAAAEGLILALRWSSNYRLLARALSDGSLSVEAGVRLQGGGLTPQAREAEAALATDPTGLRLEAGAVLESPWLLIGFFDGALDAAGNVLREYLSMTRLRDPDWTREVLGVGWNSWFAFGTGVDYDSMLEEANLARQLGVEIFYVDHGWQAAMGDWVPDPVAFPRDTLLRLANQVHRMGMRFGLWVAFGVAEPGSLLLQRHPEFLAVQPEPARLGIDGSLPLCLTRAREWVDAELERIVRSYRLDWLKFDQPMVAACLAPDHGHPPTVRGSLYANNAAFYAILDRLRQRAPELFIESTFDGAGYLDYGVYARSHGAWLDDAAGDPSVPVPAVQRSTFGASTGFPGRFLTLWLARPPEGFLPQGEAALPPGRSLSPEDLAYQAYSTMGGSWGVSLRLSLLSPEQLDRIRDLVASYKEFREVIPGGHVYHLAPDLLPVAPLAGGGPVRVAAPEANTWFVLQYVQPELGRCALLAVRNGPESPARLIVRPRELEPTAIYTATWDDGTIAGRATGAEFASTGLALQREPLSGGIVWVERA